jgi:hypothetical protein
MQEHTAPYIDNGTQTLSTGQCELKEHVTRVTMAWQCPIKTNSSYFTALDIGTRVSGLERKPCIVLCPTDVIHYYYCYYSAYPMPHVGNNATDVNHCGLAFINTVASMRFGI